MSEKKGSFIVFEGIDGSGKTTQINLLKQKIEALNIKCLETREPSDGPIGVMIRQCLTGRMQMDEAAPCRFILRQTGLTTSTTAQTDLKTNLKMEFV